MRILLLVCFFAMSFAKNYAQNSKNYLSLDFGFNRTFGDLAQVQNPLLPGFIKEGTNIGVHFEHRLMTYCGIQSSLRFDRSTLQRPQFFEAIQEARMPLASTLPKETLDNLQGQVGFFVKTLPLSSVISFVVGSDIAVSHIKLPEQMPDTRLAGVNSLRTNIKGYGIGYAFNGGFDLYGMGNLGIRVRAHFARNKAFFNDLDNKTLKFQNFGVSSGIFYAF